MLLKKRKNYVKSFLVVFILIFLILTLPSWGQIFGTDDRQDIYSVADYKVRYRANSVASVWRFGEVFDNGDGTSTLGLGDPRNWCETEPFRLQPYSRNEIWTAFLVAPKIVVTIGMEFPEVDQLTFVFGFKMKNATVPQTVINNKDIYKGVRKIAKGNGWTLVELDRAVNRTPLAVRRNGKVESIQKVYAIGHPHKMPIKYVDRAMVLPVPDSSERKKYFLASLDNGYGNQGSPVFNSNTHVVEGMILWFDDFQWVNSGGCMRSKVCIQASCLIKCIRTTEFSKNLPPGFKNHIATALGQTDHTWEFAIGENKDLFGIHKSNTGSGKTEVYILHASKNYKRTVKHFTSLHQTGPNWEFALASNNDLFAIKKSNTLSQKTEVYILKADKNYQSIKSEISNLHQTGSNWEFLVASNRDVYGIKKNNTISGNTEVYILKADRKYKSIKTRITCLHQTGPGWEFALAPSNNDLFAIDKCGAHTGSTEVHILSAKEKYRCLKLRTGTCARGTDKTWTYVLDWYNTLYAIKKSDTGSKKTELHIFSKIQ